jgi:hypothetical protein
MFESASTKCRSANTNADRRRFLTLTISTSSGAPIVLLVPFSSRWRTAFGHIRARDHYEVSLLVTPEDNGCSLPAKRVQGPVLACARDIVVAR